MLIDQKSFWRFVLIMTVIFGAFASNGYAAAGEEKDSDSSQILQLKTHTVTAKKVEQDVQDVSASISVFEGADMDDLGVTDLRDLSMFVPNLGFQRIGNHYTEFNYRGIGGVTTMSKTWNINVDGVTIPYAAIDTLFDVERVEIMRGGQGALYGRNTHAGVINVVTRNPSDEATAEASGSYGSFGTRRATGTISGPAGESVKYRLAFQHRATDGYMKNETNGKDPSNWNDQITGRGRIYYQATEDTDVTFSMMADTYSGNNDSWANVAAGKKYDSTSNFQGKDKGGMASGNMTLSHDLKDSRFTSITAYTNSRYETAVDMDATPASIIDLTDYRETFNTFSQEFRLASTDEKSDLRWLTGLFFLYEDIDHSTLVTMMGTPMGSTSEIKTYSSAWFGQGVYDLTPQWEVEASLRLDVERRDFDWQDKFSSADYTDSNTWFAPLPSATVTYKINENQRVYGSISRGYRSGDYIANELSYNNIKTKSNVNPEYTLTYEAGYKSQFMDRRVRFNTSVFYVDWTDMQVAAVVGGAQVRDNAGRAHSYGIEADISWLAAKGLNVFANAGWMNAEFDEYDGHGSGDPVGNKIPNTNEYSIGGGVAYNHEAGYFGTCSATYFGPKYMEELNIIKQDPYTVVNAKLGYKADSWHVAVYGENLLDEEYLVRAYQTMPGMQPGLYASPRAVGLEAGINYAF